jgi:Zn-dependent metalloprotease
MKKDRLQNEIKSRTKNMIKKLNTRTLLWIFFIQISLGIFSAADINAQTGSVLDSIRFTKIPQNQSAAPDSGPNAFIDNHPPDTRAVKVEKRLKQKLDTVKTEKITSAGSQNVPIDRQQSRAEKLRSHLSGEIDIWLRHDAGTPRQIKVKKTARKNGAVLERAKKGKPAGREQDEDTARDFLRSKRGLLRISDPDKELCLSRYTTDNLNYRHIRYNQRFKDIPVWPAELNVHLDENGNVNLMNGAFIPTPKRMVTKPVWNADDAVEAARKAVPEGNTAKANDPLLIIYAPEDKSCRLAWKIELAISIESNWLVIVDASNGSTLMAYNQVLNNSVSGSGTDLTGKNRQLNVWQEGGQYYMIDASKSMYDDASDPPAIAKTRGAIIILDMAHNETPDQGGPFNASNVTSQKASAGWLPDAVSLAYCISETSDYYLERHNRASIDGKNSSAIGLVRVGQNFANAFWSTEYNAVFFGDAAPYAGALDIVAHEFTHGVTSFTCNLIYQDQSGAMNEAFSDIFGEMVEARTTGSTDWIDGTLLNDNGRDLKDPSSLEVMNGYYYPSKMSEFYGRNHPLLQQLVNQDYGGVHINATILSHCFYLLAEGLDSAIGLRDAEKIFYRAQTIHLLRSSQFIDARLACISSAEELFGDDSVQVQKVREAFDAVEIFDSVSTPEPPPARPVSGDDASVFIYYDPYLASHFLARYEKDLNDPITGSQISCYDIARSRPSVTGDGSLAFFVDSVNDACFLDTNPSICESCLDLPGTISSVAMSPDGDVYSFVLLDEAGEPTNDITVVDLRKPDGQQTKTFPLVSPATEGESLNTVLYADTMDITSDNRYIVYDAYNILEFSDGTKLGVWSIYALDLVTEQIISLVEPYSEFDIGFPALSQTTNHIMTFDVVDHTTGNTSIVTYDFYNDLADVAGVLSGSWSVPGYTGDDSAIVYSVPDASTYTGSSLVMQLLAQNAITPTGLPSAYISDADFGVVYRRGAYTPPVSEISVSPKTLSFGEVKLAEKQTRSITITNTGTGGLLLETVSLTGPNASQFNIVGGCAGQVLSSSGSCQFQIEFLPTSAGAKSTTLTVRSDDPGTPEVTVSIAGTGASEDSSGGGGGGGGCFIKSLSE